MGLKGVPAIISPQLLHTLSSMGHGDEIVLADIHFPTSRICKEGSSVEIRAEGVKIPELLAAILEFLPLDEYSYSPYKVMEVVVRDRGSVDTSIWQNYKDIVSKAEGKEIEYQEVERFEFYEQAKNAYAIVHTSEQAKYANLILRKGLVKY